MFWRLVLRDFHLTKDFYFGVCTITKYYTLPISYPGIQKSPDSMSTWAQQIFKVMKLNVWIQDFRLNIWPRNWFQLNRPSYYCHNQIYMNKLGLSWAKLSSNWDLAALWLGFVVTNMINRKYLVRSLVSFCSLSRPTWHFMPFTSDLKHQL